VARIAAPVRARRTFQNTNPSPLFRRNDCRDQPGLPATGNKHVVVVMMSFHVDASLSALKLHTFAYNFF